MGRSIYPPPGSIKSIQRGDATTNVTIAAVNPGKSQLTNTGVASGNTGGENASLRLSGATTLTYNRGSLTGANPPIVAWELTEYY